MKLRRLLCVVALGATLAACGAVPEPEPVPETTTTTATETVTETVTHTPAPNPPPEPSAEQIAASRVPVDIRAKVASLMMVGVSNYEDALWKLQQGAGGIFITSWADPGLLNQPGRDIAALREAIGRPFSVAIDFEGGRVQRHAQVLGSFPSPRALAGMDLAGVEEVGLQIGTSLRNHGVTVDFAPVLDVDGAGLQVVGDRAFSTDPVVAGEYGAAFARGLARAGVEPVYKHFPGHGRASGDSHLGAVTTPPLGDLLGHDTRAFATALGGQEAAVMMGHLSVPGLGDGVTPASISPAAYQLLRSGEYPGGQPFAGVTYTDDLSGMAAISASVPEAVTSAIAAGADQALWSSGAQLSAAIDAVVHALHTGRIAPDVIDDAAFRVQLQQLNQGL